MDIVKYRYDGGGEFRLDDFPTVDTEPFAGKAEALERTTDNLKKITVLQDKLYAENKESVLAVFQAMDAAGKDSAIKNVMSGVNPQGTEVYNFKQPSQEELDHDYLWRAVIHLPERGNIGIFNRSYYEDVLIGKVHKLYLKQNLPDRCKTDDIFEKRYRQIRDFERYLWENGIRVVKFYLHISKEEQKRRFLKRIEDQSKNWKFSESDIRERSYWEDYMRAYEAAIAATATEHAPWYIVPSDKKWFSRAVISSVLLDTLETIHPQYPSLPEEKSAMLEACREALLDDGKR